MLHQVVCVDRVKMDLQRPKAKPVADAICAAVAMAVGPEETLVSGYWSTVAQRSLWMKMLREKNIGEQSMHISKQNDPKRRF